MGRALSVVHRSQLPPSAVPKVEIISTLTSVATDLWKGNQWDNSCMWCGQRWHMYKQGRHCTVRKHRHGRKAPYPTASKQQISNHVKDTLLILKILKRLNKKKTVKLLQHRLRYCVFQFLCVGQAQERLKSKFPLRQLTGVCHQTPPAW